jgi:hypothetical protein
MRPFIMLALLGCAAVLFSHSTHEGTSEPKFSELTRKDSDRLDAQSAVVAGVAKRLYGTAALTRTHKDLLILQRLLDDKAFKKSQTYELQSMGVAFGDVLSNDLPLRWVMITDKYGTDPTVRFENTSLNINAFTMISEAG